MVLNRQANELERLRLACKVDSEEVVPKAQEMLRLMDVKCRPGSLGQGELCRTVLAFDLACRTLARPVPHKTAVKLCGAPEAVYASALGTAQRLLGVQRRFTCEDVGTAVGNTRVGIMATRELKIYKERFLASYTARQVASIDLNSTVYSVAAFYLCAKKIKCPVDKQRLLELSLVGEAEFTSVCRSMLDLCYSTLGVSISDKPSAERLQQFERAAALNNTGRPSSSGQNPIATPHHPSATANNGGRPSSLSLAAALGSRKCGSSNYGGGGVRPSIPLTRTAGGGAPKNHVAFLARSIQAAAAKRRHGGTTVEAVELGGANDANNALHDRIHRSKRARPGAPNGNARTGSANHGATVSTSTATGPRTVPNSSPALFNPYAAARPPAGGSVRGARMVPASPRSHRTAESAKGGNEGRGHMPLNDGAVNGQSAHKGGSASSGDIGRGGVGVKPGGGGYAEWKDRVLTSMENRVKESAAASSARAVHGGCSSTMSAGSGDIAAENSNNSIASPASTSTTQASLTSFFAPSAREDSGSK